MGTVWGGVGCLNPQREDRITGWLQRKSSLEGIISQATCKHHVTSFPGSQDGRKLSQLSSVLRQDAHSTSPAQLTNPLPPLSLKCGSIFRIPRQKSFWLLHDESEKPECPCEQPGGGGSTSLRREWKANHSLFRLSVFAQGC